MARCAFAARLTLKIILLVIFCVLSVTAVRTVMPADLDQIPQWEVPSNARHPLASTNRHRV